MATTSRASPTPSTSSDSTTTSTHPDEFHEKHPEAAHLRIGDLQRHQHARHIRHRPAAQQGERLRSAWCRGAKLPRTWWKFYGTRDWEAGGFAWTGFDYRGEPTPYGWPSINSQFGIVDMCGFPKDYFYYYKAWWRKEPSLHLFPHWNWEGREGDEIPVWVYSNLDEVELFVNGKSLGSQKVPHLGHVEWKVRYEPGAIEARGSQERQGGSDGEARDHRRPRHQLRLTADRTEIDADGEDLAILKVEALDNRRQRWCRPQTIRSAFNISGAGKLIGVGNGDPNCQESDKGPGGRSSMGWRR